MPLARSVDIRRAPPGKLVVIDLNVERRFGPGNGGGHRDGQIVRSYLARSEAQRCQCRRHTLNRALGCTKLRPELPGSKELVVIGRPGTYSSSMKLASAADLGV